MILARYSGVCADCGHRFSEGTPIRSDDDAEGWVHVTCPEGSDPASLRRGETVCTTCWLVHPEGECDR